MAMQSFAKRPCTTALHGELEMGSGFWLLVNLFRVKHDWVHVFTVSVKSGIIQGNQS